jgi:hypothetical protein
LLEFSIIDRVVLYQIYFAGNIFKTLLRHQFLVVIDVFPDYIFVGNLAFGFYTNILMTLVNQQRKISTKGIIRDRKFINCRVQWLPCFTSSSSASFLIILGTPEVRNHNSLWDIPKPSSNHFNCFWTL